MEQEDLRGTRQQDPPHDEAESPAHRAAVMRAQNALYARKPIPPEHQALLDRRISPNGLAWRAWRCPRCGYHLADEANLIGALRKKCPNCKFPSIAEFNRIGEDQELREYIDQRNNTVPVSMADVAAMRLALRLFEEGHCEASRSQTLVRTLHLVLDQLPPT